MKFHRLFFPEMHAVELPSRARQIVDADFDNFDYLLAMDSSNLRNLQAMAPTEAHWAKIHLLRNFDPHSRADCFPAFFSAHSNSQRKTRMWMTLITGMTLVSRIASMFVMQLAKDCWRR